MQSVIARHEKLLHELLESPALPFDENLHSALPFGGGVYRIFQKGSNWSSSEYVGRTGNLHERVYCNHFMGNRRASALKKKLIDQRVELDEEGVKQYMKRQCSVQFLIIEESQALSFEHFALAILRPKYND